MLMAGGEGSAEHAGPAACVWEKPEDSTESELPEVGRAAVASQTSRAKENRGPQASNERKMVFLWSQGFLF